MSKPWLTIIGIGDNGMDSLTPEAAKLLEQAETVIAPQRVLDTVELPGKQLEPWTGKLHETVEALVTRRGERTAILATGDPMHFGIGATLAKRIPIDEMRIFPSPSAFSLAAARLGWPLQDCACISLHGRPVENLKRHLAPGARIIALTSDGGTIAQIAGLLCDAGYGGSLLTVLEHMGGERERTVQLVASEVGNKHFADFNTIAIECIADAETPVYGTAPGLPDDAFTHDGQLTKRELRAVTLAHLRPFPGALLWDIGAGCGSVGIEWMRAARGARAIAIEHHATRLELIKENAAALGVPDMEIVEGRAPDALLGLPQPDAIFCGGGLSADGVFEAAWDALKRGGIFVANAVTLESEARLLAFFEAHGGELTRLVVSRAKPVGKLNGWKPFMPVTIWSVSK